MPVPNTTTFTLADVVAEFGGGPTSLSGCFAVAVDSHFNPSYKGSKNSLLNFRNYSRSNSVYIVQEAFPKFHFMSVTMATSCTVTVDYDDGYVYTGTTSSNSTFEVIPEHIYSTSKVHNLTLSAPGITTLSTDGNNESGITSIDVSELTDLVGLHVDKNSISAIDVSKNTKLTSFGARYNQIISADFSNNPLLQSIDLNYNTTLTSLNTTGCTKVVLLRLWNGSLSSLDVSHMPELTQIEMAGNNVTTLDITNNPKLNSLNARNNGFTEATMNSIMITLDDNGLSNGGVWFLSGNAALTGQGLTAKANLVAKGWNIM